jgi:hypothetical protein
MNRHQWTCFLGVLALELASPCASAQTKPAPAPTVAPVAAPAAAETPEDKMRKLFEDGTADLNAGKFADAADKLRTVWLQKNSYDVAGNLGAALLKLGKHVEAARFLSYAEQNFPTGGKPSVKKWIEELLVEAKKEVVAVRVRVNVDGADVTVSDQLLGKSPFTSETYVAPGVLIVEAKKEGFEPSRIESKGEKGAAVEITVKLKAKGEPRPVVSERPKWPAYVLGGAGAAGLITGGVLLGVAHAARGDLEKKSKAITADGVGCPADPRCAELKSAVQSGDTMSRAGVGLLIGGSVLGAVAGAYWLWPSGQPKQGAVRIVPVASMQGGGVFASGSF